MVKHYELFFHNEKKSNYSLSQKVRVQIIFIFIILFSLYLIGDKDGNILIKVDTSFINNKGAGPISLQNGFNKILPYNSNKCKFIRAKRIRPIKNYNINYFFISMPLMSETAFDKWKKYNKTNILLLGPNFVPDNWFKFPIQTIWKERRFREILQLIKGVIVHSERVRNHLSIKSNNTDLLSKFIIQRPCTYIMPKNIKSFNERTIDILFYEKYADLNRTNQGKHLLNLLKKSKKRIESLIYGKYQKDYAFKLANNSKFIIYFSFYDTGALSLKEIQNYGVLSFTHQMDLIISNKTGFYIPELELDDMTIAFNKIMRIVEDVSKISPNTKSISNINQNINRCEKALDDLCNSII